MKRELIRSTTLPGDAGESEVLTWTLHPARADSARLPVVLTVIAAAAVCVYLMFHAWLPALAAVFLLAAATREYLFPVTYRLSERGVEVRGPGLHAEMGWNDVRRILPQPGGLTLSPFARPSRLDSFRGVSLRFDSLGRAGDRTSVLDYLGHVLPELMAHDLTGGITETETV